MFSLNMYMFSLQVTYVFTTSNNCSRLLLARSTDFKFELGAYSEDILKKILAIGDIKFVVLAIY